MKSRLERWHSVGDTISAVSREDIAWIDGEEDVYIEGANNCTGNIWTALVEMHNAVSEALHNRLLLQAEGVCVTEESSVIDEGV